MPMNEEARARLMAGATHVFTPSAPIDQRALFAGRTDQLRAVMGAVGQKGQHAILWCRPA